MTYSFVVLFTVSESNPSAGFSLDKQVFHCFSCHASGDMAWLLFKSLPNEFRSVREADSWLKENYGVDYSRLDSSIRSKLIDYEDFGEDESSVSDREVKPRYEMALYHSGKATYKYFFNRGFTKRTMRERMVGYDEKSRTVTVPVFYDDGELAGILGRYIDPDRPHNQRYKIYKFKTGSVLYNLDVINRNNKTCILCEGLLDGLWLYQCGVENGLATLTNSVSKQQVKYLRKYFDTIIDFSDNDKRGKEFTEALMGLCSEDFELYTVKHLYPDGCKDPQDCSPEQIHHMIAHAKPLNSRENLRVASYD